jgi:rubrerythrin
VAKTIDNLGAAFAGESQANRRYLAFAQKADEDGQPQVARLFRAAAAAETVHALNHLRVMGGVQSTQDNLKTAIGGEHEEFTSMYPGFIQIAEQEEQEEARESFTLAKRVEGIHHKLFSGTLEALAEGKELEQGVYYVCQHCGNTVLGEAPKACPVCGRPQEQFKRIE